MTIWFVAKDEDLSADWICKLYHFCITFNVPLAAMIMVAIAVDRYFSICHPFLHVVTPQRARIAVVCLSLFAFLLGTVTALAYNYRQIVPAQQSFFNGITSNLSSAHSPKSLSMFPYFADQQVDDALNEHTEVTNKLKLGSVDASTHVRNHNSSVFGANDHEQTFLQTTNKCQPTDEILPYYFILKYQKLYASIYLLSLLAVFIIYALIYRSVSRRRQWRRRQRSKKPMGKSMVTMTMEVEDDVLKSKDVIGQQQSIEESFPQSTPVTFPASSQNGSDSNTRKKSRPGEHNSSKERKDFYILANIRTAAMLFVVTLVFVASFLPAWLMAVNILPFQLVIFYCYFIYNVSNPVIYAFMNHTFRKELKRMLSRSFNCSRRAMVKGQR